MNARLHLSPTISTAFVHLIDQIREKKKSDALIPINILLPTAGVIHDLRGQSGDTMGVQMYQFYRLGNAVLNETGIPIHEINDTAIRRLIRCILADLYAEGKLTTFTPVWEKPGFIEVMLNWVREMKSQGVFPEQYDEYAQCEGNEQDLQLAELYMRYQIFMQDHNYSDADGLLWVTAEALEDNPELFRKNGPLYVLGFDQFTPVQIRILRHLSNRFTDFCVYLLWDENRSDDSLALVRLRRTRDMLLENIPLEIVVLREKYAQNKPISHLRQNVFEPSGTQSVDSDTLWLIEAPSREAEVRRALREVKRFLIEGVSPADVAILTPNKEAYLPIIRTVAIEYGVPVEYGHPLMGNPAVFALDNLLTLPGSYSWQSTFETLRSPYFRQSWLSDEQIDLLDRLSRERPVVAGRDQWLFAIQPLEMDAMDIEDEDLSSPPLVATLPPETLNAIEEGLTAFFDHISPPATATYREYTWWLQTAIIGYSSEKESGEDEAIELTTTLDLLGCCKDNSYSQRDMQALGLVLRALRRLLASAETVPDIEEISWATYRDEVIGLLRVLHIPPDPMQANVRFARLEEGRSRVVDHLFLLGISEGEFPRQPPADALYAPGDRETHPLPLVRFSTADDASLWWQVIGNVCRQLFLLRPYIDDNGAPWQPSPFWEAVRACFIDLQPEIIRIAEHPMPEDAASQSELLVALAQTGAQTIPKKMKTEWIYAGEAESIMHQRTSYRPPGRFEGVLGSASLKDELSERYGVRHTWSVSRLNRYANCPYGFFTEYVLKLKARKDPEEGLDALQRGSILHSILEHLYKHMTENGISPTQANLEIIIDQLKKSCDEVFPLAPQRYGFRAGTLWVYEQQELFRMLSALVTWECQQNDTEAQFSPYLQEIRFGIGQDGLPPLEVEGDSARFRLRGVIDRVDHDFDGNLRLIDYKSGSTKYSKTDLQKGLALQTALYALAAEHFLINDQGCLVDSHYLHIPKREPSGKLIFRGSVCEDEWVETAIQQAAWSVSNVRSGVFPSAPAKPALGGRSCREKCEFAPICRVTRQSFVKGRRGRLA